MVARDPAPSSQSQIAEGTSIGAAEVAQAEALKLQRNPFYVPPVTTAPRRAPVIQPSRNEMPAQERAVLLIAALLGNK